MANYIHLNWEQYGKLLDGLWSDLSQKLADNNVKIDAIIPILREGAFVGMPLAYRLNTYKVLPIQFKYILFDGGNELKKIASLPKVEYELPESPVFLLCDTFPAGGHTKELAIAEVQKTYPKAKFVFASLMQDKTADVLLDVLFSAFAVDVDENWKTTNEVFRAVSVENVLEVVLPWENAGEEQASVDQKEWKYN